MRNAKRLEYGLADTFAALFIVLLAIHLIAIVLD